MKKILAWMGGKDRLARALVNLFPHHRVYVEPFAGGAATFFRKQPARQEVLADNDCDLIRFYDDVRRGKLRRCQVACSRDMGRLLKKIRPTACEYFALNKCSFAGQANSGGKFSLDLSTHRGDGRSILANIGIYERRLRRTHLICGDFEDVMRRFDSPDTLFYLDPPYVGYEKYYRTGREKDLPRRIRRAIRQAKGKVILSFNDCPEIRKLFCDDPAFRCNSAKAGYGSQEWRDKRGTKPKRRELVIRNY